MFSLSRLFRKKKIWLSILTFVLIIIVWQHEIIWYGINQGYGQGKILYKSVPVEEVLNDTQFPDSLKKKILLIGEIRKYAFDSLGLNKSESYTTFYDQKGQPLLWNVTACEPYQLKDKTWSFPLIGNFSYKGYFNKKKAENEAEELKKQGYDVAVDEVSGWSTLGYFKDPILSSMLKRKPGSLSSLIIHELTHGTLYVKNNVSYNENLASFVGDQGAYRFLAFKYGADSPEYKQYVKYQKFQDDYAVLVLSQANRLDSLYKTLVNLTSEEDRKAKKTVLMEEIRHKLNDFLVKSGATGAVITELNNTYFMDFRRYLKDQDVFEKEFREKFNSDFTVYLQYLKEKYRSL